MKSKRLFRVFYLFGILLLAGVSYGIFVEKTGIGIPCPFRLITGWKCPGCGVTHMCVALLRLDFTAAFTANPIILMLSPVLLLIFLPYVVRYVKTGSLQLGHIQNIAIWGCIVILILFGIVRNFNFV